jgi:ParB family chromosome partitioning protein
MYKDVPLSEIVDNPFQPRQAFDPATVQSLADEIAAEGFWNGTLQGRRNARGRIELVFGHRRLRALRLLKTPSARIDVLDLSDAQMAMRSLEENLQREGLTDLEKADAVKQAVEIARTEHRAAGKNESHALKEVADRLGLSVKWVGDLCRISGAMAPKNRAPVEAGHLTAKTALAAKEWGGDAYVQTLAKQGKQAKKDGDVSKPTHMTVAAMKKAVALAPEAVQEKLKAEIVAGDIVTPKDAELRARRLASSHTRRKKEPPPDLKAVIVDWTYRVKEWEQQMRDVAPYMAYVEEVPKIADDFRAALGKLIDTAKKLL